MRGASDTSFISTYSLNRRGFDLLLPRFSRRLQVTPRAMRRGRPQLLPPDGALMLVLDFLCSRSRYNVLCRSYGITMATVSRCLRRGMAALLAVLRHEPLAVIAWPTFQEQRQWAAAVSAKSSTGIDGRFGFIDGKNYTVQRPTDVDLQNAQYNGWLHATLVTGTLCFGVDGCLIWGKHNFSGSWNDSETSRDFQEKLADPNLTLPGHGALADTAFPVRGCPLGAIMTPLKGKDLDAINNVSIIRYLELRSADITSLRQAAEWGMGAVEKPYQRLLERLPFNQAKRAQFLEIVHRLYNFRLRITGISQIRSFFLA